MVAFASNRRAAKAPFANAYSTMDSFPGWLNNLLAHGYVSTSFFFLLSGFILAYLYWTPGGELSTTRQRFWWQRFTRIYPAHLIALGVTILLTMPRYFIDPNAPPVALAAASAVATATLTQAWVPPLVPIWSWPTWALSAVVFLYLIMPWLMRVLAKLSRPQQIALLVASPLISLVPTLVFLQFFPDGAEGQPELADLHRLDAAVLGGAFRGGHADVASLRDQRAAFLGSNPCEALVHVPGCQAPAIDPGPQAAG